MFVRHGAASTSSVAIRVDGRERRVPAGVSLAAALLLGGDAVTGRTSVSGRPRGPWCLMGTCFGCLVEVDGVSDVRACMTPVRDGMQVALAPAEPGASAARDLDPWGGTV